LAPLQGWPLIELDEWPLRRKLGGGADRLEMAVRSRRQTAPNLTSEPVRKGSLVFGSQVAQSPAPVEKGNWNSAWGAETELLTRVPACRSEGGLRGLHQ